MSLINNGYQLKDDIRESFLLAEKKKDLGNEQYKIKNYARAIRFFSDAISLCPNHPAYFVYRSACHMMLSDFKQALADARYAVNLEPSFDKGFIRIAKCCLMLGDLAGFEQAGKALMNLDPKSTALNMEIQNIIQLRDLEAKSVALYEKRDFRSTIFQLDNALKIAPACQRYKLLKAECLALLGNVDEASAIALNIMKEDRKCAEATFIRGLCLYYMGNLDKCVILFHQALTLQPDHQKAKMYRMTALNLKSCKDCGDELFKAGRFEDAYAAYSKALQIDLSNNDANSKLYYKRAQMSYEMKLKKDCVRECSSALDIRNDYLDAILLRAKCYSELEEYEESARDYEQAFKMVKSAEIIELLRGAKYDMNKPKTFCYYKTLGVDRNATGEEIKAAYRKRALVHHPDRHILLLENEKREQQRKFREVGQAYTVLSDVQKKARYDSGQDLSKCEADFDPTETFQKFFFSANQGSFHIQF
ncbi:dnaJ homolog subfamily C member 7-like [Phlebotomus argentipes]|uniref:dnaJ homolog subfamily C member 7-like n=1 Tax=Phlebotomus argentipes TaxID=94469 RepID=UPI002892B3C6|nr:dnaJ homolog subfamily C member 7-like [Phlebotomus argentipes]